MDLSAEEDGRITLTDKGEKVLEVPAVMVIECGRDTLIDQ